MRRPTMLAVLLGTVIAAVGLSGVALAGGGCHGTITEADETGEDQATVEMVDQCFSASVLRVDPGTTVKFVHEDAGLTHNVGGTGWGFYGDMHEGDTFRATFDDPGVYPFGCSYHPGMTGAIVVGDGYGAGMGSSVLNSGPVAEDAEPSPVAAASGGGGSAIALLAAGVVGLALGAGAVGMLRLRARPSGG